MANAQARYFEKLDAEVVRCFLCPHHCRLKEGQVGICRVRSNQDGNLLTHNYGEITSLALDPIEKKPLFHFYPGTCILSAGSYGCNLGCSFCQNWSIAHGTPPTNYMEAEELVARTQSCRRDGSIGLAFTYNEPSIWYEYIMDVAPKLKELGLKTVMVTNGYIDKQPLEDLLTCIDAFNIDVKGFNEHFYPQMCKGRLGPVKETVERAIGQAHVEITTLLIPGKNDSEAEIRALAQWLASLDRQTVLHLSKYHPDYKLDLPPTPEATLFRAREIALEYLDFVFTGNILGEVNNTNCLRCGHELIHRSVYRTKITGIKDRRCAQCGAELEYIKGL
ncbi:MAG: AmmeMemoRadiSam system radical SAM enzyme [Syntrophomonadaceae bacterium]